MRVKVKLHAVLKELLPVGPEVEVEEGATIAALCDRLGVEEDMRDLITLNGEQVFDLNLQLADGDSIEIFPAVLGGSAYLEEGIRLFDEGEYFIAHETLEEHWIDAPAEERDFLQGLIHVCVAMYHQSRGNIKGAGIQLRKAGERLSGYPSVHRGVDIGALRVWLDSATSAISEGSDVPRFTMRRA